MERGKNQRQSRGGGVRLIQMRIFIVHFIISKMGEIVGNGRIKSKNTESLI